MKNLTIKTTPFIATLMVLAGCADLMKRTPNQTAADKFMAIDSPGCSGELNLPVGGENKIVGMIGVQARYDYTKESTVVIGKAFKTSKALTVNPYLVIGDEKKPTNERRSELKKVDLAPMGGALGIRFIPALTPTGEGSTVLSSIQLNVSKEIRDVNPQLTLPIDPKHTVYVGTASLAPTGPYVDVQKQIAEAVAKAIAEAKDGKKDTSSTEQASTEEQVAAVTKAAIVSSSEGGFLGYTAVNIFAPNTGQITVALPADPRDSNKSGDYAAGFTAEKVETQGEKPTNYLKIPIAAKTPATAQQPTRLLIELKNVSGDDKWKAVCIYPDNGQTEVALKMKATALGSTKSEDLKGGFQLTVLRSLVSRVNLMKVENERETGNEGMMYVETRTGFTAVATIPKDKE